MLRHMYCEDVAGGACGDASDWRRSTDGSITVTGEGEVAAGDWGDLTDAVVRLDPRVTDVTDTGDAALMLDYLVGRIRSF